MHAEYLNLIGFFIEYLMQPTGTYLILKIKQHAVYQSCVHMQQLPFLGVQERLNDLHIE